jgi:hypothetical protein
VAESYLRLAPYSKNADAWCADIKDRALISKMEEAYASSYEQLGRRADPAFIANRVADSLHSLASWAHSGFNVFDLTHSLASLFLLTETDEEVPDLPFQAFAVKFPDRLITTPGRPDIFFKEALFSLTTRQDSPGITYALLWTNGEFANGWLHWPLTALPDVSKTPDPDEIRILVHLLRGLCSFLSTKAEPLVVSNAKRLLKPGPAKRVFVVGRTVKISPELRLYAASAGTTPLWKLQNRFVVRGHWRNQVCGKNLADRRKTWIAPHWKGPEGAEAWRHVYECHP